MTYDDDLQLVADDDYQPDLVAWAGGILIGIYGTITAAAIGVGIWWLW